MYCKNFVMGSSFDAALSYQFIFLPVISCYIDWSLNASVSEYSVHIFKNIWNAGEMSKNRSIITQLPQPHYIDNTAGNLLFRLGFFQQSTDPQINRLDLIRRKMIKDLAAVVKFVFVKAGERVIHTDATVSRTRLVGALLL